MKFKIRKVSDPSHFEATFHPSQHNTPQPNGQAIWDDEAESWVIDIPNLEALMELEAKQDIHNEQTGLIIYGGDEHELPIIMIYDDYRE